MSPAIVEKYGPSPSLAQSQSTRDRALFSAIVMIFAGCALNNISLEFLVKADSGIGNTVTATQFLFVSMFAFCSQVSMRDGSMYIEKRHLPLQYYLRTTSMFVVISIINNFVFLFNISLPFHMLFRSCSLVVNMTLGFCIFGKQYSRFQVISCLLITAGVLMATMADSFVQIRCCDLTNAPPAPSISHLGSSKSGLIPWMIGVSLLMISLVLSSLLGHWQEQGFRRFGRYPQENLFYSHIFSLPLFVFLSPDIYDRLSAMLSRPTDIIAPLIAIPIPYTTLLAVNIISQYICVRGVYNITCLSTTLTCTFTLTIRKFFSLLISGLFMKNKLTAFHWIGAVLVFAGTVLYSSLSPIPDTTKTTKTE